MTKMQHCYKMHHYSSLLHLYSKPNDITEILLNVTLNTITLILDVKQQSINTILTISSCSISFEYSKILFLKNFYSTLKQIVNIYFKAKHPQMYDINFMFNFFIIVLLHLIIETI